MELVTYQLPTHLWFLLPANATRTVFPVTKDVLLEHPLLRPVASPGLSPLLGVVGERIWFSTNRLRFRYLQPATEPHDLSLLQSVLSRLRRLSRQAGIPRYCHVTTFEKIAEFPTVVTLGEELQEASAGAILNKSAFETSISEAHLDVLALEDGSQGALHEDLLLDALEALQVHNYRSAIVYTAFAAEAAASKVLEMAYAQALAGTAPHLRVHNIPVHSGDVSTKDPVYEALAKSRDDFRRLLHERPLYLLQRSLLLDRQDLYRDMLKLYKTRNSIVHSTPKEDVFEMNEADATLCIKSTIDLLEWLGVAHDFTLPGGLISAATGRDVVFGAS